MALYTSTLKGLSTVLHVTEVLIFMVSLQTVTIDSLTLDNLLNPQTVRSERNSTFSVNPWMAIAECPDGEPKECTTGGSR